MEWLVTAAVVVVLAFALPRLVGRASKGARAKGGFGGAVLGIGLAFSITCDPRANEAIEQRADQASEDEERESRGEG